MWTLGDSVPKCSYCVPSVLGTLRRAVEHNLHNTTHTDRRTDGETTFALFGTVLEPKRKIVKISTSIVYKKCVLFHWSTGSLNLGIT